MAWSYRNDRADEVYNEAGGPTIVMDNEPFGGDTPSPAMLRDKKLREVKPPPKDAVITQFQEVPGQNVPRFIEGEGDTKKDKEIVKAMKEQQKEEAKNEKKEAKK